MYTIEDLPKEIRDAFSTAFRSCLPTPLGPAGEMAQERAEEEALIALALHTGLAALICKEREATNKYIQEITPKFAKQWLNSQAELEETMKGA